MDGEHIKRFTEAAQSGDYGAVMNLTEAEHLLLTQSLKKMMAKSGYVEQLEVAGALFTAFGDTFFSSPIQAVTLMLRLKRLCASELDLREKSEGVLKTALDILAGTGKTP